MGEGGSCTVQEQRKPVWRGSGMRGAGGSRDLSDGSGERDKNPSWQSLALVGGRVFRRAIRGQRNGEEGLSRGALGCGIGPGDDRKGASHGAGAVRGHEGPRTPGPGACVLRKLLEGKEGVLQEQPLEPEQGLGSASPGQGEPRGGKASTAGERAFLRGQTPARKRP